MPATSDSPKGRAGFLTLVSLLVVALVTVVLVLARDGRCSCLSRSDPGCSLRASSADRDTTDYSAADSPAAGAGVRRGRRGAGDLGTHVSGALSQSDGRPLCHRLVGWRSAGRMRRHLFLLAVLVLRLQRHGASGVRGLSHHDGDRLFAGAHERQNERNHIAARGICCQHNARLLQLLLRSARQQQRLEPFDSALVAAWSDWDSAVDAAFCDWRAPSACGSGCDAADATAQHAGAGRRICASAWASGSNTRVSASS